MTDYASVLLPILVDGSGNITGIDLEALTLKQTTLAGITNIDITQSTGSGANKFATLKNNGGEVVQILTSGTINNGTGTYGTISDARLKEFLDDEVPDYSERLSKIKLYKYRLKADISALGRENAPVYLGVSAQDFKKLFPGLVEKDPETGILTVKTGAALQFITIQAVQMLMKRMDSLEASAA